MSGPRPRFWEDFTVGDVLVTGRRTVDGGDVSRHAVTVIAVWMVSPNLTGAVKRIRSSPRSASVVPSNHPARFCWPLETASVRMPWATRVAKGVVLAYSSSVTRTAISDAKSFATAASRVIDRPASSRAAAW